MASPRRTRSVAGIPSPTGPFSQAVSFAGLLFVAGLRGIDPATGRPAPTDGERVELIFRHLHEVLTAHGATHSDVLTTRVYVTDMAGIRPLVNDAYTAFFGPHLPARTIVQVAGLNQGDSVEIEVVAADRRAPADSEGEQQT